MTTMALVWVCVRQKKEHSCPWRLQNNNNPTHADPYLYSGHVSIKTGPELNLISKYPDFNSVKHLCELLFKWAGRKVELWTIGAFLVRMTLFYRSVLLPCQENENMSVYCYDKTLSCYYNNKILVFNNIL